MRQARARTLLATWTLSGHWDQCQLQPCVHQPAALGHALLHPAVPQGVGARGEGRVHTDARQRVNGGTKRAPSARRAVTGPRKA